MMKNKLLALVAFVFLFNAVRGQENAGNTFKTITIGTQTWMGENLNVEKFRNGDAVPEAKTDAEWKQAGKDQKPAWCYYKNDAENGAVYGKLYNWYAFTDARGLAPQGWHMPSREEWLVLVDTLGFQAISGKFLKAKKKSKEPGFAAPLAGIRISEGPFMYAKTHAYLWTTSVHQKAGAPYSFRLYEDSDKCFFQFDGDKTYGYSVRCVKDK